jgi:MerR family transcriptional regulator, light-induced transcriptional regulator
LFRRYDAGVADDDRLDLQRAAEELGVHYQTAYRWVRTGKLPAQLVGGRYVVGRDDIAATAAQRATPRAPAPPTAKRMTRAAERMHDALVSGDESSVRQLAKGLVDEGAAVVDVIQEVLVPSLVRIGAAWHAGRLTIWVEHRASAIIERLLGELSPNPRGRRRGTVMVAAVSGDLHSLPTSMAAVVLRDDNWAVEHLGANMPPDELVRFCAEHDVDVAVLSSTNPETAELAAETADRLRAAGTPAVLGGPGRTLDDLVESTRTAVSAPAG